MLGINETKKFYRFTTVEYATLGQDGDYVSSPYPNPKLILNEYELHKETPKGYWIGYGDLNSLHSKSQWVSKTARKRFAYPTKEEAMVNFVTRTERRAKILRRQLSSCEIALTLAKSKKYD